jgi:chromosome segregation ATPase
MLSRASSNLQNEAGSNSATSSGLFRGLLGGYGNSSAETDGRIKEMSNQLSVLQDELESKITENETLVIESSELKRTKRELEIRLESLENQLRSSNDAAKSAIDEMERLRRDKNNLSTKLEGNEIQIDSLRRDLALQIELCRKLQVTNDSLQTQVDQETEARKQAENALRETKTSLIESDSKLSCLSKDLESNEAEKQKLLRELLNEKAKQESLNLRIDQLEDELSVMSIRRRPTVVPPNEDMSIPPCGDNMVPCCYRSEYYLSRLKTAEEALRMTKNGRN